MIAISTTGYREKTGERNRSAKTRKEARPEQSDESAGAKGGRGGSECPQALEKSSLMSYTTPRNIALAALAAVMLSACGTLSTWNVGDIPSLPADPRPLGEVVDDLASPLVTQGRTPGLIVGLRLPDGSTRFFGYGTTVQGADTPPGPDTLFAIGSLSKGFLGAITASVVQEGKLSWTDQLGGLLPPEYPLSPDGAAITVEQLATHTSGLPRQQPTLRTLSYFVGYLFTGENFYRHLDQDAVLGALADFTAPSFREPLYSNIGYGILGYVVERRSGQTLDALLAERITGPLGLSHTGYTPEALPDYDLRTRGYAGDQPKFIARGQPTPDWRMTSILRGSASLYSSARDLLTFADAYLRPNTTPLSLALTDTLRIRYQRPREAAAVAWIADEVNGVEIVYQVGLIAGYTSYLALDPVHGTAVVVLQNAFNWDYSLGHKLMLLLAEPGRSSDAHF
jgi:CubicO group peptidase (beta-lactamase class C family)